MSAVPTIETERLLLRPPVREDFDAFADLNADPEAARYIGGHFYRADGVTVQDAGHAWAEAYVDNLGWVGFDPTNRACATEAYIRTAVGLDYGEASPIRGVRSGGGTETMTVKVSFPSQYQQQSQ